MNRSALIHRVLVKPAVTWTNPFWKRLTGSSCTPSLYLATAPAHTSTPFMGWENCHRDSPGYTFTAQRFFSSFSPPLGNSHRHLLLCVPGWTRSTEGPSCWTEPWMRLSWTTAEWRPWGLMGRQENTNLTGANVTKSLESWSRKL